MTTPNHLISKLVTPSYEASLCLSETNQHQKICHILGINPVKANLPLSETNQHQ